MTLFDQVATIFIPLLVIGFFIWGFFYRFLWLFFRTCSKRKNFFQALAAEGLTHNNSIIEGTCCNRQVFISFLGINQETMRLDMIFKKGITLPVHDLFELLKNNDVIHSLCQGAKFDYQQLGGIEASTKNSDDLQQGVSLLIDTTYDVKHLKNLLAVEAKIAEIIEKKHW